MKICDQVVAPDGFLMLKKDERHVYLGSGKLSELVTLVQFTTQTAGRRVLINRIERRQFEEAAAANKIIVAEKQYSLPPWLSEIEGADLEQLDLGRDNPKLTNRERIEKRYGFIHELLSRLDEILASTNPFSIINQHAAQCEPRQNRTRLAEWFFAYLCYGRKLNALYPEFQGKIGVWDRADQKYLNACLGRESISHGRDHGYSGAQFSEGIAKAYQARAERGKPMSEIFTESLREVWKCRSRMNSDGVHEMYQPEGKSFPDSYGKFRYQVIKKFGIEAVQTARYGETRMRSKVLAPKGMYTEEIANLMQEFECDGYFLKERARSALSDEAMPRLCVVRGVCVGSKSVTGIGFSLEGETEEAYRGMLFSTAIPKNKFAQLFGLDGAIVAWLCQGVAPQIIIDRGSAPIKAIINNLQAKFPVKEMTESYSGQSKPSVEGSHPRDIHLEGAPSYVLSEHSLIQMVQQEISRAALDNHSSYVGDQILGKRVGDRVLPSPYALWNYLDSRGRNDAISITFDDAVRTFLTPKIFSLRHDGVWLENRCFHSNQLDRKGMRNQVSPGQEVKIRGYTLSMCLLYVWVEVGRELFELKQKLSYFDGKAERLITMEELRLEAERKRELDSAHRSSKAAAMVEAARLFEEATGAKWMSGTRHPGKPKKFTQTTRLETEVLKPKAGKSKAA